MTRTIDMTNIENKHKTYTYNLKNEHDVKITNLFTNFLDSIKIKISGNTLSISVLEPMGPVLKFTNISNLKDVNLNVYQKEGHPDYLDKNFQLMIDDVLETHPENVDYWTIKKRTLTGTNFDDDIDITNSAKYTVVDGIGWTVNSLKGDDTIEGTTGKDTITGGLGKDTIVFSEGNDLVKLTKNEELVIDVSALGLNTPEDIIRAQGDIQASTNKNGDLILTMLNEEDTQHQITINKFVKTNGVGAKGKVNLYLGKNEESQDVYYDLNTKAIMYFDEENASYKKKSNTATLTGTRLGDDISVDGGAINALNNADNAKVTIKAGDGNNFINLMNALNTNTITSGAGDDVIEIEDTSDIASTPKALTTVKAGAGKNKITIGGAGNNSIITGKDDDTFEISGESTSTLKAGSGNNIIKINDDSFGTITLVDEKIKNTKNDIVFDEGVNLTAAYKSGDNLILKAGDSSLIINNYFLQTGKNAVKTLDGYELANLGGFLEKNGLELAVEGTKKITGTDLSETIMGSDKADTINANGGADDIEGGKGKDTINAGAGNNRIIYHTGDGNDTILYGGGEDTLVFDDGMTVSAKYSGKNLLVDYTGKDYTGNDVKNTITIKDFLNNQSVKYIQIGENAPKAIEEYLEGTYISTKENEIWGANGIKLERANHVFLFDLENTSGENSFGSDNISSPNKSADKYTDTIKFNDFSVQQNLNISYDDDVMTLNPWNYRPTANLEDTSAGHVNYNWVSLNKQKAVVKDSDGQTYNVKFSSNGTKIDNSKLTTNTINLVGKGKPTTVISNAKYNHTATNETDLNYTYNGGHDRIITGGEETTDKYTVKSALSNTTYLNISENGGEDTMTFSNTNADDIRVLFDVSKTGGVDKSRILYVHKDAVTLDNIKGAVREGVTPFTSGVLVDDADTTTKIGIDNIVTKDVENIDEAKWYSAVETKVKAWLNKYGYDNVENALWHTPIEDQTALQELIACYSDVKYSDTTGGGGGDDPQDAYVSTSDDEYWLENWGPEWGPGAKLTQGNHTFLYDIENTDDTDYPHFGYDLISSPNHMGDGNTDTFQINDFSVQHGLEFAPSNGDMEIAFWHFSDNVEENGNIGDFAGVVQYMDLLTLPKQQAVAIKDKDGVTYDVRVYSSDVNNSTKTTNMLTLIEREEMQSEDVKTTVTANNKYNYTATHNVNLRYVYNGGVDKINTYDSQNTKDEYRVNVLNNDTHFEIRENGGEDRLIFAETNADDIRILFNVSVEGFDDDDKIYIDKRRMMFVKSDQTDELVLKGIKAVAKNGYYPREGGVFVYDHNYNAGASVGIENIDTKDYYTEAAEWYNAVAAKVGAVLKQYHQYNVSDAIWSETPVEGLAEALIAAYKSVKYSERDTIERGAEIDDYVAPTEHTGTDGDDEFMSVAADEIFYLKKGNDSITFGKTFNGEEQNGDHIYSESVANRGNTDTLYFSDYGFADDRQSLYFQFNGNDFFMNAYDNDTETDGGYVTYHGFMGDNAPKLKVVDTTGTYDINGYKTAQTLNHTSDKHGQIEYIAAEEGTSTVTGNTKYNYLETYGGANLIYNYKGGRDTVNTSVATNDTYNVGAITSATSFSIQDAGGLNDTLNITDSNANNLRLFIDVTVTDDTDPDNIEYTFDKSNIAIVNKNSFVAENLPSIYLGFNCPGVHAYANGIYDEEAESIVGTGIETININNTQVNVNDVWYDAVAQSVAGWLSGTEFASASEAIEAYNNNPEGVDISGLVTAYTSVQYK